MATEQYPLGKKLYLAACAVRRTDPVRAELEWENWEEGFMTRLEWQQTAEEFLKQDEKIGVHPDNRGDLSHLDGLS